MNFVLQLSILIVFFELSRQIGDLKCRYDFDSVYFDLTGIKHGKNDRYESREMFKSCYFKMLHLIKCSAQQTLLFVEVSIPRIPLFPHSTSSRRTFCSVLGLYPALKISAENPHIGRNHFKKYRTTKKGMN